MTEDQEYKAVIDNAFRQILESLRPMGIIDISVFADTVTLIYWDDYRFTREMPVMLSYVDQGLVPDRPILH